MSESETQIVYLSASKEWFSEKRCSSPNYLGTSLHPLEIKQKRYMKIFEQIEYEHRNDPQPKCQTAGCNNDNRAFNGGMCLQHSPTTNNKSECKCDCIYCIGNKHCDSLECGDTLKKQEEKCEDCGLLKPDKHFAYCHPTPKVATSKCCGAKIEKRSYTHFLGDPELKNNLEEYCVKCKVATSEKGKCVGDCAFKSSLHKSKDDCGRLPVDTPHESEDWSESIEGKVEVILGGVEIGIVDLIKEYYQRGMKKGFLKGMNYLPQDDIEDIETKAKSDILSLAVQEIEKEYRHSEVNSRHEYLVDNRQRNNVAI